MTSIKKVPHFLVFCAGESIVAIPSQLQFYRDVAQFGSAFDWGSKGRWFESSHPDQLN